MWYIYTRYAILINNNFQFKLNRNKHNMYIGYIIVEFTVNAKIVTLVSIHGLNKGLPQFYIDLKVQV